MVDSWQMIQRWLEGAIVVCTNFPQGIKIHQGEQYSQAVLFLMEVPVNLDSASSYSPNKAICKNAKKLCMWQYVPQNAEIQGQMSNVQNPYDIPLYWLVNYNIL